jgi:Na+/phosphate symporter
MTIIAFLSVLVCVVGLVLYFASTQNSKVMETGRIMFACGLLVSLYMLGSAAGVNLTVR